MGENRLKLLPKSKSGSLPAMPIRNILSNCNKYPYHFWSPVNTVVSKGIHAAQDGGIIVRYVERYSKCFKKLYD
jgi:hypothetical protein